MSPKKSTEIVPLMLRLREGLRKKVERAAKAAAHSLNAEVVKRIEYTFDEEERWEAQHKDLEEHREELEQQQREYYEEQATIAAEHKAALRDSRLITAMVGTNDNAELLRVLLYLINSHPEWTASDERRKALADQIHSFITSADDIFQGQTK